MRKLEEMNILIVDDSRFSLTLTKTFLGKFGYKNMICAKSAAEAFTALNMEDNDAATPDIDLILMDIVMDKMDGIEACRRIKNDKRFDDIPIIMLTGDTKNKSLEDAFQAGAVDYITKPLNKIELKARVRSVLRLKREILERKDREARLKKVTLELECLSSMDGLTGIANRRYFDETLGKEWRRAMRDPKPISLVICDIDHFKPYNDYYGHQAGDEALKQTAQTLYKIGSRVGNLAARYGGEEFALILPDTENRHTMAIAERFRQEVESLQIPHASSKAHDYMTASVGVATLLPDNDTSPSDLIEMAGKALYNAKERGRNRVENYC